jgi:hypothetical protein
MKDMMRHFSKLTQSLLVSSSLVWAMACDGGSDSSSNNPPAAAGTGGGGTGASATGGLPAAGGSVGSGTTAGATGTSSSSQPAPASGGTATGLLIICEAAWKTYVASNPVGLTLGYRVSTENKDGQGAVMSSSVSSSEKRIIESNETQVVQVSTSIIEGLPQPVENQSEVTREEFVEGCGRVGGLNLPAGTVSVLEQSRQSVTVPAGTFDTNYTKYKASSTQLGGDSVLTNWILTDGSNIVVKSDVSLVSSAVGLTFQNHTVTELTKIIRP